MSPNRLLLPLLCAGLLFTGLPSHAEAFRCGGRLVSTGDLRTEVRDKCGEPDYVNSFPSAVLPGLGPVQETEHWYYNPGPTRFIRKLVFREGRLRSIHSLGRGFREGNPGSCSHRDISEGMSEFELKARCGEPLESRTEWRRASPNRYPGQQPIMPVEEWLYEFGRGQFRQLIVLEAGEVVRIERRDKPN